MLSQAQIDEIEANRTTIPTLDELLERLKLVDPITKYWFHLVASGQALPNLNGATAQLAAQAMCILFKHISELPQDLDTNGGSLNNPTPEPQRQD